MYLERLTLSAGAALSGLCWARKLKPTKNTGLLHTPSSTPEFFAGRAAGFDAAPRATVPLYSGRALHRECALLRGAWHGSVHYAFALDPLHFVHRDRKCRVSPARAGAHEFSRREKRESSLYWGTGPLPAIIPQDMTGSWFHIDGGDLRASYWHNFKVGLFLKKSEASTVQSVRRAYMRCWRRIYRGHRMKEPNPNRTSPDVAITDGECIDLRFPNFAFMRGAGII